MDTGERLRMLRDSKRMSQEEVAKHIGVGRTTYLKYESGENKPTRKLKELADFFGVTTDELLGRDTISVSNFKEVSLPRDTMKVPILGSVRCGPGGYAEPDIDGYIYIDGREGEEYFALRCEGDSMIDEHIFDGDIAIVRKQSDVDNGALAVVVIDDEEGTLKRVHFSHDKRGRREAITLQSANSRDQKKYRPRTFIHKDMERVRICGRVIEVRRGY